MASTEPQPPPLDPSLLRQVTWMLDSYRHWIGRELIPRGCNAMEDATLLWETSLVVVAHGTEEDPLLSFGNRQALILWETEFDELIGVPSRFTAEPMAREEREAMLKRTEAFGFVDDYRGVRISRMGNRFEILRATVWNVMDDQGQAAGQAAAFEHWVKLT